MTRQSNYQPPTGKTRLVAAEKPKEPFMTSKEMLALKKYNSTSECPKCGIWATDDIYGSEQNPRMEGVLIGQRAPLRYIRRVCGDENTGCGHTRYELPLDWSEKEAANLVDWCDALVRKEDAEKQLKHLANEASNA